MRAHPPDRDPAGFQQLREAFEMLEPEAHRVDLLAAREAAPPEPAPTAEAAPVATEAAPEPGDAAPPQPAVPATEAVRSAPTPVIGRVAPLPGPAATAPLAADPLVPPAARLSLRTVTEDILARVEGGDLSGAQEITQRWRGSDLDDHREVSAAVAVRWALTRDLVAVATDTPESLRAVLARGIAADDLSAAIREFELFQALDAVGARAFERQLALWGGNLHKALLPALSAHPQHQPDRDPQQGVPRWLWSLIALAAMAMLRSASCDGPSRPDLRELQRPAPKLDPPPLRLDGHPPAPTPRLELPRDFVTPSPPRPPRAPPASPP